MTELIMDRTALDVSSGNAKGQYTYEDLNRVEGAVAELVTLAAQLDIYPGLTTKTDWGLPDSFTVGAWPVESQMTRYLQNVHTLCDAFSLPHGNVPVVMDNLTWKGANAIEQALHGAYLRVQGILGTYQYSGEMFAGEET